MSDERAHRLGDLQLKIMQVLWRTPQVGVADVQQQIGGMLAYTTIATMLRKMENRGLVRHREEGRRFLYEAAVTADAVSRSMTNRVVDRLFEGSRRGCDLQKAGSQLLRLPPQFNSRPTQPHLRPFAAQRLDSASGHPANVSG